MSVLKRLNAATPNRRTVTLCLDGSAQAEWELLAAQLDEAAIKDQKQGSMKLEHTAAVVTQMDAVRERMLAAQVTFTFERVPWEERVDLQAEHPPRPDNLADRVRGYNVTTFYPALIRASCISVTDIAGDTATDIPEATWQALMGDPDAGLKGSLSAGQINELRATAEQVNDGTSSVPPSARSLLVSQDSGASLAQPSPGTSPRDASTAGSPPGSPTSSETTTDGSSDS